MMMKKKSVKEDVLKKVREWAEQDIHKGARCVILLAARNIKTLAILLEVSNDWDIPAQMLDELRDCAEALLQAEVDMRNQRGMLLAILDNLKETNEGRSDPGGCVAGCRCLD